MPEKKELQPLQPPTPTRARRRQNKSEAAQPLSGSPATEISSSKLRPPLHGPSEEEVRRRAYEIWLARGREHGRDQEDWWQAERELRERKIA